LYNNIINIKKVNVMPSTHDIGRITVPYDMGILPHSGNKFTMKYEEAEIGSGKYEFTAYLTGRKGELTCEINATVQVHNIDANVELAAIRTFAAYVTQIDATGDLSSSATVGWDSNVSNLVITFPNMAPTNVALDHKIQEAASNIAQFGGLNHRKRIEDRWQEMLHKKQEELTALRAKVRAPLNDNPVVDKAVIDKDLFDEAFRRAHPLPRAGAGALLHLPPRNPWGREVTTTRQFDACITEALHGLEAQSTAWRDDYGAAKAEAEKRFNKSHPTPDELRAHNKQLAEIAENYMKPSQQAIARAEWVLANSKSFTA
jgi:hypothetical protein